jgi:hypothetical protein
VSDGTSGLVLGSSYQSPTASNLGRFGRPAAPLLTFDAVGRTVLSRTASGLPVASRPPALEAYTCTLQCASTRKRIRECKCVPPSGGRRSGAETTGAGGPLNTTVRQSQSGLAEEPRANLGSDRSERSELRVVPKQVVNRRVRDGRCRSWGESACDVPGRCGDRLSGCSLKSKRAAKRSAGTARRLGFRKARVQ